MSRLLGAQVWLTGEEYDPISTTVIAVNADATEAAGRLTVPLQIDGRRFSHVVFLSRLEGEQLSEIFAKSYAGCGVTLIPDDRFRENDPLDTSWWRGGYAFVGSVSLTPSD